ncbi:MAG TPA: hypothetical protein VMU29_13985 [Smithella sp.]|nr:hypothetical protein [Smithella sp.]
MILTFLKQKHKKAIFFFAAFFLFFALMVAFHHHDDDCGHSDCPLCVAGNLLSGGGIEENTSFVFHAAISYFRQPEEPFLVTLFAISQYSTRAPPALSV